MSIERATAERAQELQQAYSKILSAVQKANSDYNRTARLVAVSKLKPASDILALHEQAGVLHFGENYPQELADKAAQLPREIQWHFIGTLQSNKCKMLAAIPNLFAIETLTSTKQAGMLAKAVVDRPPLNVFIQVNTSHEDNKSGVDPASNDLVELAKYVLTECSPQLTLKGLMTIGSYDASVSQDPNPDFDALAKARDDLLDRLRQDEQLRDKTTELKLELSMGMSADFVQAIKQGSDSVRVGSSIFGERPPKKSS